MRNLTDLGNSERLFDNSNGNIKYCPELKKWYCWNGKRWQKDVDGAVMRLAVQTVRDIPEEATTSDCSDPKATVEWAKESESRHRLNSMVKLAESLPGIPIGVDKLDTNKYLFNCQNGTIDLKLGVLQSHNKNDLITHITDLEYSAYDRDKHCPRWQQFLIEITGGNTCLIEYIQKFLGYSLSGDTTEHLLHVFHGQGRNGKGTIFEIIKKILGDYCVTLSFDAIEKKASNNTLNDTAQMYGKRLVIAQEGDEGSSLNEPLVKTLTGGDVLAGRFYYAEQFNFFPTHKLILATNNKPTIKETSDAIWDRLRLIPFEKQFRGDAQDKKLKEKLEAELPGILSWLVEGFAKWQCDGLATRHTGIDEASTDYRSEEDVVQHFIQECCYENQDCQIGAKELHKAFTDWCINSGEKPIPKKIFNNRIRSRGYREHVGAGRMLKFSGIGLADIKYSSKYS